jgi:hypothetical protein
MSLRSSSRVDWVRAVTMTLRRKRVAREAQVTVIGG